MTVSAVHSEDDWLPPPARAIAPYFILLLIVFAAYGNVFDNTFLFDDEVLIRLNANLRDWSHIWDILTSSTTSAEHDPQGFYRPVQMALYLFAFHLGHGSTFFFHLLNLSLHLANTCFVYRLGRKLGFKSWGVFLAALVWGLHPLHTEAVTYMSGTADPLFTFFCLLAIIILLPDISARKILGIIPLFLLGLLSKETMVMFPLLVMSCIFLTNSQRLTLRTYFRTWPLWIIALIYTVWRLHTDNLFGSQVNAYSSALPDYAPNRMYEDHPLYRVYTFLATLPSYLALLIWPYDLHMDRDFTLYTTAWLQPVITGVGIAIVAVVQIIRSSKKPNHCIEMSWGLLWFTGAHAPESGIIIPMNSLFLEHWMYLPSVGLLLGLGETAAQLLENRLRAYSLVCSFAVVLFASLMFVKTYAQNTIWHDSVIFYNNIIHLSKYSLHAHANLGAYYDGIGDYTDALDQFNRAIEISDTLAGVRYNMARAYLRETDRRDHIPDAIASLQRSLEIDPKFYRSYQLLGDIYDNLGDKDKAKYYYDRADALLTQGQ